MPARTPSALAGLRGRARIGRLQQAPTPSDHQPIGVAWTRLREEIPWFAPTLSVHLFPTGRRCPTTTFRRTPTLVSERLETLHQFFRERLRRGYRASHHGAISAATAGIPCRSYFLSQAGTKLDVDKLRAQLTLAGYAPHDQVVGPGEYSVRGGLIDLFPMGSAVPYRLDLFDDQTRPFAPSTSTASAASIL